MEQEEQMSLAQLRGTRVAPTQLYELQDSGQVPAAVQIVVSVAGTSIKRRFTPSSPPQNTPSTSEEKKKGGGLGPWLSALTRVRSRSTKSEPCQSNCLFVSPRLSTNAQIRGYLREEPSVLTKPKKKRENQTQTLTSNPFIQENRKFGQCHGNTSSL